MPEYRRYYLPGGTFFFTIVTYQRASLFSNEDNLDHLRKAIRQVMRETPFDMPAAVVLPDHIHLLATLPPGDADYSKRIGRIKALFTRYLSNHEKASSVTSASRRAHRESAVWQRRFWEHTIEDDEDFEQHLNYIHHNPVKHGLASCPHQWVHSSFRKWVEAGLYPVDWCCCCEGRTPAPPKFLRVKSMAGE
jgi:putative transposase